MFFWRSLAFFFHPHFIYTATQNPTPNPTQTWTKQMNISHSNNYPFCIHYCNLQFVFKYSYLDLYSPIFSFNLLFFPINFLFLLLIFYLLFENSSYQPYCVKCNFFFFNLINQSPQKKKMYFNRKENYKKKKEKKKKKKGKSKIYPSCPQQKSKCPTI